VSAHEHESGAPAESRSSVQVALNAKGEAQVTVKVYAGEDADEVARIRGVAIEQFYEALRACGRGTA